jgi:hypothetical protein
MELNRHFSIEEIEITNKYIRSFWHPWQLGTANKNYTEILSAFSQNSYPSSRKQIKTNIGKNAEGKGNFIHCW